MRQSWRPLVLAAALSVSASVGVASAQIVLVRNAPAGSAIEIVLNSATIGTAKADNAGNATVTAKLPASTSQTDVHIFVDVCDQSRRILFIERGLQPQDPTPGCDRKEIAGWFLLQPVTSLLVDVGNIPSVWLRQGSIPAQWLSQEPGVEIPGRTAPKGLVVFGGGGFEKFRDATTVACGNSSDCTGKDFRPAYVVGAEFWFTRFLAAEVTYLKPSNATASGTGTNYRFDTSLETQVLTIAGKVGVPLGAVRVYGRAGMNYHRATSATNETFDPVTITNEDGTTTTIPGGTQTLEFQTRGWSWMFAAGLEGWVSSRFAIFGEAGLVNLKGNAVGGGEGAVNDRLTSLLIGAKVRIF